MKLVFTILFLGSFFVSNAQLSGVSRSFENQSDIYNIIRNFKNKTDYGKDIGLDKIKGSPYLSEEFSTGRILLKGEVRGTYSLRYNIYKDEIEVTYENSIGSLLKADYVDIELDGKIFKIFNYYNNDRIEKGYFIVLNDGEKCKLLLKKNILYVPYRKATTPLETDQKARFEQFDNYYMKMGSEAPVKLKLKKNQLLDILSDKKKEIKDFIKKEKIDLKNQKDLESVIVYYNSL